MNVKLKNVIKDNTSCNFCNKGELNDIGDNLIYPYKTIYVFQRGNNSLEAAICDECFEELYIKVKLLKSCKEK